MSIIEYPDTVFVYMVTFKILVFKTTLLFTNVKNTI
jgi:hypothetical protein